MYHELARELRKNPTEAERRLWSHLRQRQVSQHRFRRQAPIGPYIVDFVCIEKQCIVELDGGQHAARREEDRRRTEWLESQGFRVIRFWNNLIFEELESVLETIGLALEASLDPPPRPSPTRGEGDVELPPSRAEGVDELSAMRAERFSESIPMNREGPAESGRRGRSLSANSHTRR